jgi:hypothetical protein
MSLNAWKLAQTGAAFTQDPRISLRAFIYNNWSQTSVYSDTGLARSLVHIGTRFDDLSKQYIVIVEKLAVTSTNTVLGKQRIRVRDAYRIQVYARGFSAIDKSYKMCQYLEDLIGANPTALRSDGIDEIELSEFSPVNTQDEKPSAGLGKSQLIVRYAATCTLIYDKYIG